MYFVGLDLAWGERKPTGVAVVDDDGALVHVSAQTDDASILAAIRPVRRRRLRGRYRCAADRDQPDRQPAVRGGAQQGLREVPGRRASVQHRQARVRERPPRRSPAAALDLDLDPFSPRPRRALEVYPHAASVALFRLGRTLKYKDKQGRKFEKMRSELLRLMTLIEGLDERRPCRCGSHEHDDWQRLRQFGRNRTRKSELRRVEDPVDAVLCAYVALYSVRRPDDVTVYGDVDTGYILTPTLPPGLTPQPAEPIPAVARTPSPTTRPDDRPSSPPPITTSGW